MARKALIEKAKRKQKLIDQYADKRAELVKIVKDPNTVLEQKRQAYKALSKLPRSSSGTRLRNICQLTGRSRGYMGFFKISRIMFRDLARQGVLPGVKKASW